MTTLDRYPGIVKACFLICVDNGGLHRDRPEKQVRKEIAAFIERQPPDILPPIDAWLAALSEDDLETACCGEHSEAEAIMAASPVFTDKLLNDYFDEVC
jgi:hypothetical protein